MNLFVYGTLLVPKIWEAVTGAPDTRSASGTLHEYRIERVDQADFPAIVNTGSSADTVWGRVMYDLSPDSLARLDAYEDKFYERVSVPIAVGNEEVHANVYRVPVEVAAEILSGDPWTLEWFEENALDHYWDRLFS